MVPTNSPSPGNTQAKKALSNEQGISKRSEKRVGRSGWVSATSEKHTGAKGICGPVRRLTEVKLFTHSWIGTLLYPALTANSVKTQKSFSAVQISTVNI